MGLDRRIGGKFLHAGPGYGGSCFPKDTAALAAFAREAGVRMGIVQATARANRDQSRRMIEKIAAALGSPRGKRVAILGLSFKPNTDDLRAAPALEIAAGLRKRGARISAFDPVALAAARKHPALRGATVAAAAHAAARGADAAVIVTEWNEFRNLDLRRLKRIMRRPLLCDLRNIYEPEEVEKAGFRYVGVGRGRLRRKGKP
jgi:UDPglucose 6-dehydrogenase